MLEPVVPPNNDDMVSWVFVLEPAAMLYEAVIVILAPASVE